MNILVIAAHPDDEVLGCGAAMSKHAEKGDNVNLVVVADGASARYDKDMISTLKQFCENSCITLGINKPIFLGFEDQMLDTIPLIEITKKLQKIIQEVNPEIIYTHFYSDLNKDHRIVFQATITACRPFNSKVKKIFSYEVNSSTEWNFIESFNPNFFIDIDEYLEKKISALSCYKSEMHEFPHPRSSEAVMALAKYRGFQSGFNAAEAFILIRGYD